MVDPDICLKANIETYNKVETWIPVDQDQQVQNNFQNSEGIGITRSCLCLVKELEHSVNPVELNGNLYGKI